MKMIYKEEIMTEPIEFDQIFFNIKKTTTIHWKVTKEELLAAYKNGDRNFKRIELTNIDLSNYDFSGANFNGAYFFNVSLVNSNFAECSMADIVIENSRLDYCNFHKIKAMSITFSLCNLRYTNFTEAKINYAEFFNSNLFNTSFIKADVSNSQFYMTSMTSTSCNQTNFENTKFENVDFTDSYLIKTSFRNSHFINVSLLNAHFEETNLLDVKGIYSVFGMNLSSRTDQLYGGVTVIDGKIQLCLWAGCQGPKSVDAILSMVTETHGNNGYARNYKWAIRCIESMFKIDNSQHKWDYLIELYNRAAAEEGEE